jgi:AcrR family transcriptional regulator
MSYRRSPGEVAEDVDEDLAIPPRRPGARWSRDVNSREDRATIAALRPGTEPAGSPARGSRPMADAKARVRDPEGTRAAILEAATRIFASRGFVGASMRDITDAAGITKSPIYYHFGSKEGLYAAVKQNLAAACDRQGVGIDRADERPADPRAELRRLFETFRDHEALLHRPREPDGHAGRPGRILARGAPQRSRCRRGWSARVRLSRPGDRAGRARAFAALAPPCRGSDRTTTLGGGPASLRDGTNKGDCLPCVPTRRTCGPISRASWPS